ncbi:MAG: DNA gyrase subunit A [Sedimentisphaerales bacterium]|nr:DNA gyrase subunit A [Sedimentisphaerales bacterium]
MTQAQERIEDLSILDELKDSYLNYAMSVIISRALPDVRDGLKPSQRRILVAMNDLNLGPRSKHRKCAKIAGDTSGNYHPHGEAVVYPTLVRMGQPWNLRTTLVDPQGNFGSIDGDPPAAMRYTEARMTAAAAEMLTDINFDTVDFVPNYDEVTTEPVVLPGKFPNLLVNGAVGIAVGMATSLPPHNVGEVCDALIKLIEEPDCGFRDLMEIMPGPDFPTGGIICGRKGIIDGYTTGRGNVTIRAKYHIETNKKGRDLIVVDEIPYQTVKSQIVVKIAECVNSGSISGISDVRDESDRKGMRIVVELRRDADSNVVINQLFKHTSLQNNFSIINIALVKNRPLTLNVKQMMELYLEHRKDVIRRRTRYLLRKAQTRAHIVEGLLLAQTDIDEIIRIIRQSANVPEAKAALMAKPLRLREHATLKKLLPAEFVAEKSNQDQYLTGPQADAILSMQLQRLTGLELEKLAKEFASLCEEIAGYEAILADEMLVMDIIREDLYEMKEKFSNPRRTEITGEITDFNIEDLIEEEDVVVTISHDGYIKRLPIDTYRSQGRGGRGVKGSDNKEGDFIEHLFIASTHDYLCIFTNRGRCYWQRVYDIPTLGRTSRGRSVANLVQMLKDEKVAEILPVRDFDERKLVMATQNGIVKKTVLSAFGNVRRNGVNAISLDPGDDVIGARITSGNDDIILGTRDGMAIRFNEQDARAMGRTARGVKGIKLRGKDLVVDMVVPGEGTSLLTVCENGFGKRTDLNDYRSQKRGGLGLINIKTTERNGKVVALKAVNPDDDLMLISGNGIMMRTGLGQLREIGRNTQGVKLIRIDSGDKLVAVARVAKENGKENNGSNGESNSGSPEADSDIENGSEQQDSAPASEQDNSSASPTDSAD